MGENEREGQEQDEVIRSSALLHKNKTSRPPYHWYRGRDFCCKKSIRDVSLPLPGQGITDAFVLFGFALSLRRHCRVSMHYRQNTWRGCAGK